MCFCFYCPSFSGTAFCGSRFLWVPSHALCAFGFLSWLLWDSFYWFRVPASLGLCPSLVCSCFSRLVSLGQLLVSLGPGFSWTAICRFWLIRVPFTLFPEMHGLRDFDAALDSVALISLINYISRVLAVARSGYFGRASVLSGFRPLWAPPLFLSAFVFFCPGLSGTAFVLLGNRFFWILPSIVRFCVLLSQLVWDSFLRVLAYPGPFPFFSQDGWSG